MSVTKPARDRISATKFAFPKQRKEPLENASHVGDDCGWRRRTDGVSASALQEGKTYEDSLGLRGLKRMGKKKWRRYVAHIVEELQKALEADYVVLGGGNVKKIKTLPAKTRLGANGNAFVGGYRLWSAKQGAGTNAFAA
jgi:hypothetical protein